MNPITITLIIIAAAILIKLLFMKDIHINISLKKGIKKSLHFIINKLNQMSEVVDQLNAKVDRIIAGTNGVAADIRAIKDQLVGGVTRAEAEALGARLEAAASSLESLDAETPAAG